MPDHADQSLDVEVRRFQSGVTTDNFQVGARQGNLASAQLAELGALIRYKKARSDLLQATGELLEARHIRFAVRPGDGPGPG